MRSILYIFFISLLSSCASQQKQADHAYRYFRQNPTGLARLCADQFPVKEQWLPGKEIIQTDTIQLAGEIIPCPPTNNQKTDFIRCPSTKNIIQKIFKTDTVIRENTARIIDLNNQLQASQHQKDLYHNLAKKLGWILFGLILIGISYSFVRFKII